MKKVYLMCYMPLFIVVFGCTEVHYSKVASGEPETGLFCAYSDEQNNYPKKEVFLRFAFGYIGVPEQTIQEENKTKKIILSLENSDNLETFVVRDISWEEFNREEYACFVKEARGCGCQQVDRQIKFNHSELVYIPQAMFVSDKGSFRFIVTLSYKPSGETEPSTLGTSVELWYKMAEDMVIISENAPSQPF